MPSTDEALAPVRTAVAEGAWSTAMDALRRLPDREPDPEQLELSAAAAYGLGDLETTLSAWESVHGIHLQRGELVQAARAAAMVGMHLMMDTGLMAPVRGWLGRVDRLLEDHDETPVHGLAAMIRAYERLMSGDLELARSWARRAIEVGDRHGVVPASTLGRVAAARVRIFDGDVAEGIEVLDDVAVMLMSGQIDPLTAGMVYCELICAMQGLGEYARADEWTRAMDAVRGAGKFFGGINGRCRIHRAEMLRLRGQCAEAEDEALHACEELRPWMRREFGWPLTELGTIRLRRGDLAGAEEAFRAAHHGGWEPQPGLALLHLAQGDVDTAMSLIRDALERPMQIPWKERPPVGGLSRAPLLEACVPIAIAAAELDTADRAAAELADLADVYGNTAIRAVADLARARTALARDHEVAVSAARAAVEGWCTIGAPFEAATARLVLAAALRAAGRDDVAQFEQDAATASLHEIGAVAIGMPTSSTSDRPVEGAATTAMASGIFRRDGDMRTVNFAGRSVALRDLKGMRYLERLLDQPGREFHALDLVAVDVGSLPIAGRALEDDRLSLAADHSGPVIDDEARRAYRRRLDEIEQDLAEAEQLGDGERIARATFDRDFIVGELSRAFGIGGRPRTAGSTSERARTSVTRAIRYALSRIAEQHAELADHLQATITTGTYCSYRPDPRVPITWDT